MKKGFFRRFISIVFCATLIFYSFVPAFAAVGACSCGNSPVIQVRGIGETLYDENGNEIFSTDNIVNGILPVMPQLAEFLATQDIDTFVNAVSTAVNTIFAPVAYDNDMNRDSVVTVGYSTAPVETYMDFENMGSEETLAFMLYEELGEKHTYYFTYDWTGNPFEIAENLNDFIQEVKATSGHDKVSICAESMGGSITNTYLAMYGYDDVETVVMSNSAFNGLEMLGQLFTGNPEIDGNALARLISQSIRGNAEYGSLLEYIPVFEQLALMANDIFAAAGDRMYAEILIPIFGYIPSFWCLIPEYSYLEAMDYMLGDAGLNLKAFVYSYYSLVANPTDARVDEMVESDEVNYFNVSNYNRYIAPVTPSAKWNSDGVIETYNTSGFATVADMGETLGDDYVQAVDTGKNMISPDNVIDASTCQAPMQTWFIKNLGHVAYGTDDGTGDFYIWLLTADEQYTVDSNPEYPQFMYYDTQAPQLMTFEEKEENGIPDIEVPEFQLPEINLGDLNIGSLLDIITGLFGGVIDFIGSLFGGGDDTTVDPGTDEGDDGVFGDELAGGDVSTPPTNVDTPDDNTTDNTDAPTVNNNSSNTSNNTSNNSQQSSSSNVAESVPTQISIWPLLLVLLIAIIGVAIFLFA